MPHGTIEDSEDLSYRARTLVIDAAVAGSSHHCVRSEKLSSSATK